MSGPIVIGATVTHNPVPGDFERALQSLRAVCDHVLVFDDGSNQDFVNFVKTTGVTLIHSSKPEPRLLPLRRAYLYHEAERIGADWFVYHDQDEALSPTLQHSLRAILTNLSHGVSKDSRITAVRAVIVHFYEDLLHRTISANGTHTPEEWIAWRANVGFDYYGALADLFTDMKEGASHRAIHTARQPFNAQHMSLCLKFPYAALLHYANATKERLAERLAREAKTGLINPINTLGKEFILDVPAEPEWNNINLCRKMWENEGE